MSYTDALDSKAIAQIHFNLPLCFLQQWEVWLLSVVYLPVYTIQVYIESIYTITNQ